jgi:hypothetical protein
MKRNPNYKGKWSAPYIDNPAYKGVWAPRKISNPDFFEDLTPVTSLDKIGGVGIELWTMTEDILFDNIYVGHSLEDAKALAAESFDIKRPIEEAASNVSDTSKEEADETSFSKEPLVFLQKKLNTFIEMAKIDPVLAIKLHPETAGAVGVGIVTLLGMLGTLFGVIGAAQKPVTKVSCRPLLYRKADHLHSSPPRRPMLHPLTTKRFPRLPQFPKLRIRKMLIPRSKSASK